MFESGDVISIGSDDDTLDSNYDDTSYIRITRSKAGLRKSRKTQMKAKNRTPVTIDLTDQVPQTSKKKTLVIDGDINISIDDNSDDELEENIRVMWTQNITEVKRFFLKPSQNFCSVFQDLSNTFNIPVKNIRIRNKDRIISMYDILKSLNLKVTDVLEAYAADENTDDCKTFSTNKIEVKCLIQNNKKPLVFYLHPEQNVSCLLESCAKEINSSRDHLEMRFDGYKVSPFDTPSSLDLEGGECLEVHIMQ